MPTADFSMQRVVSWLVASLLVIFGLATLGGCQANNSAELLNVIDVAPRDAEVGDHIEVLGTDLPSGSIKRATVSFRGKLHRPGQEPIEVADNCTPGTDCKTIVVDDARPTPDKVSFVFTEGLQSQFCGSGDDAAHTTFRGDVTVTFPPAAQGGQAVSGRVIGVQLDFRPPSARRLVMQARTDEGKATLAFLGLELSDDSPAGGGLRVAAVKPASPARKAGVVAGDVLLAFEGVRVASIGDVVAKPGKRLAEVTVKRGDAAPMVRQVSMTGFEPASMPNDILAALIILGIAAFILLIFMAPTAGIITWVERRVSARMQSRIGPNRAGPQGFLIWIADGIKSIMKEDIVPTDSDQTLFRLAPYLVFVGVSATFVVMPFGQYLIAADLDIGILFVIAVTSLVAIGLMTGGWASNNKWSLLGGIRAAAQVISYEIPAAVAIVCIVMMTGSLRMQDIILAQGGMGDSLLTTGGWPWHWFAFRNPVTFALFFLFFTTALAEGNRAPFDLPEAESELVAGYSTEYSGMRYLFFFFAEWANVFVFCGIATALFLGGWQVPGVTPGDQEASLALQIFGCFLFLLKSWILIFIVIWIRWTLPRVRIDQLMNLCWKWFVPLSFAAFGLCALWVLGTDPIPVTGENGLPTAGQPVIPEVLQTGIAIATFLGWIALLAYFAKRVIYNFKQSKHALHLNPFL
jgi:NADH-quinone oxidoreductase subunit H